MRNFKPVPLCLTCIFFLEDFRIFLPVIVVCTTHFQSCPLPYLTPGFGWPHIITMPRAEGVSPSLLGSVVSSELKFVSIVFQMTVLSVRVSLCPQSLLVP